MNYDDDDEASVNIDPKKISVPKGTFMSHQPRRSSRTQQARPQSPSQSEEMIAKILLNLRALNGGRQSPARSNGRSPARSNARSPVRSTARSSRGMGLMSPAYAAALAAPPALGAPVRGRMRASSGLLPPQLPPPQENKEWGISGIPEKKRSGRGWVFRVQWSGLNPATGNYYPDSWMTQTSLLRTLKPSDLNRNNIKDVTPYRRK